jgi:hypothetical protein
MRLPTPCRALRIRIIFFRVVATVAAAGGCYRVGGDGVDRTSEDRIRLALIKPIPSDFGGTVRSIRAREGKEVESSK